MWSVWRIQGPHPSASFTGTPRLPVVARLLLSTRPRTNHWHAVRTDNNKNNMSNFSPPQPPPQPPQVTEAPTRPPPEPQGFLLTTGAGRLVSPPSSATLLTATAWLAPSPEGSTVSGRFTYFCFLLPQTPAQTPDPPNPHPLLHPRSHTHAAPLLHGIIRAEGRS